ncbi:MAG: 4Fe-4S binding protein [Clostridia bacterium]|nr:4Fe-4S binding protein [Clostridia bacterium]
MNLTNLLALGTIDMETFKTIGIIVGIFGGIAIVLVILILVVGKFFKVDVDEKVTKILENLAGANCGGCGCSGCSGFANKLASGGGDISDCHVTSTENKAIIAEILGVELKDEERTVAIVHCHGGLENVAETFVYNGTPSCTACNTLYGGNKACKFGCLGCGDCASVCSEKAITVTGKLAGVDPDLCIGCGSCMSTCPKHLIGRIPESAAVYVACSSTCRGKDVMNACKVGCIGCGMCSRKCPNKAITMVNNLPVMDYTKCTGCKTCVSVCPRKIIIERL